MNIFKKIKKEYRKNNKQKAFVILIAIVVSGFLVSLGMFIANIAYKELLLSFSTKESQRAFFSADSVMECALRYDFRDRGFRINSADTDTNGFALPCNGFDFDLDSSSLDGGDWATSIYFVSFATDTNLNNLLESSEIIAQNDAAYVKLIVAKTSNGANTEVKVYGHNRYKGKGIVERALEVNY